MKTTTLNGSQKNILCMVIDGFGDDDGPAATLQSLKYFKWPHVQSVLKFAIKSDRITKKGRATIKTILKKLRKENN
jgi:hypothetical protein